MTKLTLTEATRRKIETELPQAYDIREMRVVTCAAQIQSESLDSEQRAVVASMKQSGPPLIDAEGNPTILRVVAWMAHGDSINRNRDFFVKEELQAIAASLFKAPNFGVMDFNHSAVRPWNDDDPKVLGVWYKAEYAFDQKANADQGAWGILATGMMFAWAFPEYANILLGEQARSGRVNFSMACIPGGVEYRSDTDGSYAVLHNPVFFTLSALDVPPADPDATGAITEDTAISIDDLQAAVTSADKGARMNEELIAQLKADLETAQAEVATLTGKATELEAATVRVTELETKIAELSTLETKVAELETKVAELELARGTAVAELEAARTQIIELEAAKVQLTSQLAEYEALKAENARQEKMAARLAELPEEFQKLHNNKDEAVRQALHTKWVAMDDETWAAYVEHELLGFIPQKVGFVRRSVAEGLIPAQSHGVNIQATIASVLK